MDSQPDHHADASAVELNPAFMTVAGRRLFCVRRRALATPLTMRVLVVPPFAEELNKCRRLLALCAHSLAVAGPKYGARTGPVAAIALASLPKPAGRIG